jgi:uncharacterized protein YbaR (Trm112 family)
VKEKSVLACPACGWDGSSNGENDGWFRLIEPPVTRELRVDGVSKRGTLQVSAEDTVTIEDDSIPRMLRCGNCSTEFPVPDGIRVEPT